MMKQSVTDEILVRLSTLPVALADLVAEIDGIETEQQAKNLLTRISNKAGFALEVVHDDRGRRAVRVIRAT